MVVGIRRADLQDVAALAELRAAWREASATPDFVAEFRAWVEQEGSTRWWWIAEVDGRPVGMVNVKLFSRMPGPGTTPTRWGYLSNLFVLPEARGAGVGGALIEALLAEADAQRLVRVVLSPSELAIPLYERFGFAPASSLLLREAPSPPSS